MKNSIVQFIFFAFIGFGIGYLVFNIIGDEETATNNAEQIQSNVDQQKETKEQNETETSTAAETMLETKNCLSCHAVEGLGLPGGATGPDLSEAYVNVEGKHGKPLEEFLKEPTSAVMSSVISGNPLTDEEIAQIQEELKKASEAN
ncbi:MAG: cytochrome c [Lysinibacillus sp.]|nr:cytochrome c [Lysinibacillus sp.]